MTQNRIPATQLTPNEQKAFDRAVDWIEEYDPNWFQLVSLDKFDLGNPTLCITGQVVPREVWEPSGRTSGYGYAYDHFTIATTEPFAGSIYQDHWVNEILARREAQAEEDAACEFGHQLEGRDGYYDGYYGGYDVWETLGTIETDEWNTHDEIDNRRSIVSALLDTPDVAKVTVHWADNCGKVQYRRAR